jgi:Arc/MetJ-type ribon-helix-helix transcriptional regulator
MPDLSIPDDLADRIDSRVQHTNFESADAYATYVLSEVLTRVERNTDTEAAEESTASDEAVEDRLQSLGYLEE